MFYFSKLIIALISPLGSALVLGVAAIVLSALRRQRCAFLAGSAAVLWLGLWSLPVSSSWLAQQLEADYPPVMLQLLPEKQAVVVLGGGILPATDTSAFPDLRSGADRVWHTARIYRAGKAPLIVLSGGKPGGTVQSEAQAMQTLLLDLGIPEQALILEQGSLNTSGNAKNTSRLLVDLDISDVILVTSAFHMARAKALFEAQGLKVTPAATDYQAKPYPGWGEWIPSSAALDISSRAFKEVVGRLAGR